MGDILTVLRDARALQASGKSQDAYRALVQALGTGPDPLAPGGATAEAAALLAAAARAFNDAGLAAKLDACAARPEDPNALYAAAYDLYEQRQFPAASALLYRANVLAPGHSPIVSELASALEHQMRYGEGALVIDASGLVPKDAVCTYLSGFHWMMCGDVERARERVAALSVVVEPRLAFMRDALGGMVARSDALVKAGMALDDNALTAWQGALSGTVLLHSSPHGYPDPMHGRYAFVGDSPGLEREGLTRLRAVLERTGIAIPRIVSAPDRGSRILSAAASALFGVPWSVTHPAETGPALVVAWSMETTEDTEFLRSMHDHRPGQVLFVHASSWVDPFVYAPDVTTFLHQSATSPWTGGAMKVDPDTRAVTRAEPDTRSENEIAREILEATLEEGSTSSLDDVLAIAHTLVTLPAAHRGGLGRADGKRLHQRAGGPVPSARFV